MADFAVNGMEWSSQERGRISMLRKTLGELKPEANLKVRAPGGSAELLLSEVPNRSAELLLRLMRALGKAVYWT